jgi:hypothetical protein
MTAGVQDTLREGCHLLGSLYDFSSLKTLKIPPDAVCGNNLQGAAPLRLADSLPPSPEELTLLYQFSVLQDKRNTQFEEQTWINELVYLVQQSATKFCKLRKITVLDWNPRFNFPGKEDKEIFKDVVAASIDAGIEFLMLKEILPWQTPVPYFLGILPMRDPGRDYLKGYLGGNSILNRTLGRTLSITK